ncbi:hypothetical protein [Mechercharimyces sp. CAU 1602]|uniref:hypothetical protein n=1 Tax=Mechercharimyces sp. CAU 1602 TaxID=2973933 RepID=UPI002161499F|nr:hypothetical protein [Mechercharimyces sp. CAU 1602]MCS1351188.1 hypothetical protein [Mechercharimyces sp. CAU 1602]
MKESNSDYKKPKEYKFGNTRCIVHSIFSWMSDEEQEEWFREEYAKKNPFVLNLNNAMSSCYRSIVQNEQKNEPNPK